MIKNIFLDWTDITKRRNLDQPLHQKIKSQDRKKIISNRSQVIDLASQPRMILRRKQHQELIKKGLNYLITPAQVNPNPSYHFVSLITCDPSKTKSQLEFIKNLSGYGQKHQTNTWIYKPVLDQMSTNVDSLGYVKADLLLRHLKNSYLIWIDQDYLILDQDKSMLDLISQYPDKSLILFYNDYQVRMDLMIWKPDLWSRKVLRELLVQKSSGQKPTQVLLEILSRDRERNHVLVPNQILMNPEKNWIKSYREIPSNYQSVQMKIANLQLGF